MESDDFGNPKPPTMAAAAEPTTMTQDWANLHEELLVLTAKKLTNAIHFVRFRAVCRRWRSAARPADLPPQTPWLLLANLKEGGSTAASFFCPLSKERFSLDLPSAITGKPVLGSSRGWLVIYDYVEEEDTPHLWLLNPLTASRIPLPPLRVGTLHICNASLSSDPAVGGGTRCIVMVTFPYDSEFAFCRLGDASWTMIYIGPPMQFPVSAYHKGSFYIVDGFGRTAICGLSPTDEVIHIPTVGGSFTECHLAESADGEQLFLVTAFSYVDRKLRTEVFELDKSAAQPVWSKIDGIGGNAMFLSRDSCCCVKPFESSSCRKNTVYFAHNHAGNIYLDVQGVGVPGLGDGSSEICPYPNSTWFSQPRGFWYTPIIR